MRRSILMVVTFLCTCCILSVVNAAEETKKSAVTLSTPRVAYSRGEVVEFTTHCDKDGNLNLTAITTFEKDREVRSLIDLFPAHGDHVSKLDTTSLRPGIHPIIALLTDNQNHLIDSASIEIAVREPRVDRVAFGLFGMPSEVDPEVYFKDWSQAGADHVFFDYSPGRPASFLTDRLDKGFKYNVRPIPVLDATKALLYDDEFSRKLTPEAVSSAAWAQVLMPTKTIATDEQGEAFASPRAPQTLDRAQKWIAAVMSRAKGYPGLQTIALDRRYAMALNPHNPTDPSKTGGMADFFEASQKYFKEKTGLDAPSPQPVEPGFIATDSDPFLAWTKLIGVPGEGENASIESLNRELAKTAKETLHDLQVLQAPGGYSGELDAVVAESNDYSIRAPELDTAFVIDYARALEGNAGKPVWAILGNINHWDVATYAPAAINLATKLALGKNAAGVTINTHEVASTAPVKATFANLGETVNRWGPFLRHLAPVKMPVAVLYSRTTETYQRALNWEAAKDFWNRKHRDLQRPWEHRQSFSTAYPALMLAQVPVEVITESEIEQGKLDNYDALVLIDHQYSTTTVEGKIKEFQSKGKPVFADESSVVHPAGSEVIPFDASLLTQIIQLGLRKEDTDLARIVHDRQVGLAEEMAVMIRKSLKDKKLPAPVIINSDSVAYSLSQNGDTRYLFLYNTNLSQSQKVQVTLNRQEDFVYDVLAGGKKNFQASGGKTVFETEIAAGDWNVFLLSPQEIMQLRVITEQKDKEATLRLGVLSPAGLIISGSHPLYVSVKDPKGNETPYSTYAATNLGEVSVKFRLGDNELSGKWKLEVTELASGVRVKQALEVR